MPYSWCLLNLYSFFRYFSPKLRKPQILDYVKHSVASVIVKEKRVKFLLYLNVVDHEGEFNKINNVMRRHR